MRARSSCLIALVMAACASPSVCERLEAEVEACETEATESAEDALASCEESLETCSDSDVAALDAFFDCAIDEGFDVCSATTATGLAALAPLLACVEEVEDVDPACIESFGVIPGGTFEL